MIDYFADDLNIFKMKKSSEKLKTDG